IGMVAGSATAVITGWEFATLLGIYGPLRLSLMPRAISTPVGINVSKDIGGISDLTAIFVIITGILGSLLGEFLMRRLPLRSAMARGAMMGVAAHAAGTAKEHDVGAEEGTIAGMRRILVGMVNVVAAEIFTFLR
ncbi:LrgB family protein, partial [Oceanidesulfovibrio marinus]